MRWLAVLLLLAVSVRHSSANWLADASGFTPQAVNYMLGGALEAAAFAVILRLLWVFESALWRNLAIPVCLIAIAEGVMTAGCRVVMTAEQVRAVPYGMNLCEWLTGLPLYAATQTTYVMMLAVYVVVMVGELVEYLINHLGGGT